MKKTIYLALILLLASCNPTKKLLCKTWKIEDVTFGGPGRGGYGSQIQEMIKAQVMNFKLDFSKNGNYTIIEKDTSVIGKWWFGPDKKTVYTHGAAGSNNAKLLELTKTRLVVEDADSSGKTTTFICSPLPTSSK